MPGVGNDPGENHKAGSGQGKAIVPKVRGAFLRAILQLEEEGRPLSDIIREQLEQKPLETLAALSRFVPKEMLLQVPDGEDGHQGAVLAFAYIPRKDPLPAVEDAIDAEVVSEIPRLDLKR